MKNVGGAMGTSAVACLENRIPDTNLCVGLKMDVIERLGAEGLGGFQAIRRRGLEIGGLLLGRIEPDRIIVEDRVAFACEHRNGPSYLLSEKDKEALAAAVARANTAPDEKRVVGLYRSHTRAETDPDEEDIALTREHCPDGIFLLIKPEPFNPGTAALYTAGDGLKKTPSRFSMQCVEARAERREPVEAARVEAPRVEERPVEPWPAPRPLLTTARVLEGLAQQLERARRMEATIVHTSSGRQIWKLTFRIALAAMLVLVAAFGGYTLAQWWTPALPAATWPPQAPVTVPQAPDSIALRATWNGNSLHLQWDRQAPPIRGAERGVLWITDGNRQRRLDLNQRQLTQGSIQYWPSSRDVDFKLDIFNAAGGVSESVRAVGVPVSEGTQRSVPHEQPRQDPPAPNSLPMPSVRVDVEPLPPSVLPRLAGKSPPTVPAKPLRRVIPTVPVAWHNRLADESVVSIRVDVGASGTVQHAELISRQTESTRPFDRLALNASRKWTFAPARYGERRVSSKAILRYHFGNPPLVMGQNR
jgi:TonB family protein